MMLTAEPPAPESSLPIVCELCALRVLGESYAALTTF